MAGNFLWVNKNIKSTSLSSSGDAETRNIFQFVQQKRRAPQRAATAAATKRKNSNGRVPSQETQPALLPVSIADEHHTEDGQNHSSRTQSNRNSRAPRRASSPKDPTIKPLNLRSGACVDPFDSTVVPITKPMEAIFKYYWKMVIVGGPNGKEEVLPPHVRTPQAFDAVRKQAMRDALTDKLALAGLLASMSARMVHLTQLTLPGGLSPEYYIETTIQILRDRLLDAQDRGVRADPSVYFAIWRLALAECIAGNLDAVKVHLQACRDLLEHLGDDDPMKRYVRVGVTSIDLIRGCETLDLVLTQPQEHPDYSEILSHAGKQVQIAAHAEAGSGETNIANMVRRFDPLSALMPCHDILEDAYLTMDFSLGDGLKEARAAGMFDPAFDRLIGGVLDCLTLAKLVWRTPSASQKDAQCMCNMAKDVLRGLCAFKPDVFSLHGKRLHALQLALIIMLSRATTRFAHRSCPMNAQRLKTALHGVDVNWTHQSDELLAPQQAYNEDKLLLWVLMTGHHAAYDYEMEMWFRVRAAYVAHKLGIADYVELHEHMRRYLYSWTKQKISLETVALHLETREEVEM